MHKIYTLSFLCFILLHCQEKKTYYVEDIQNPPYAENILFKTYEDIALPKFSSLIEKYRLDTIFKGEEDEFTRLLLVRQWLSDVIRINNDGPYRGEGHADKILDAALEGDGFHCGHFMIVQNAILNAFGHVTRCLGAGPGKIDMPDSHHGMNEVWVNDLNKWVLWDAKYNHHFEKNGLPLSALEVRDEYLKNKAKDILLMKGVNRIPVEYDSVFTRSKEGFAQTYAWIEWEKQGNRHSVWPNFNSELYMYEDDYFKNNTWIWDGKPHWAYNTSFMNPVPDRKAIEWTPNTIASEVMIKNDSAIISLKSDTPNLKEYQMKSLSHPAWITTDDTILLILEKDEYFLTFRTLNLAGLSGPEHHISIKSR